MSATRIEIQPVEVGVVKSYRARIEGKKDYIFENRPDENLDQFKWRLMDKYGGCIFWFQSTWKPLESDLV